MPQSITMKQVPKDVSTFADAHKELIIRVEGDDVKIVPIVSVREAKKGLEDAIRALCRNFEQRTGHVCGIASIVYTGDTVKIEVKL